MAASVTTVLTNSFAGRLIPKAKRGGEKTLTLRVSNLHCEKCVARIAEATSGLDGVTSVSGDPAGQTVTIRYREGMTEPDGIREAILESGFKLERRGRGASEAEGVQP